ALVPLSAILPRTSSPPPPFPASSLAFPLTRLGGNFTSCHVLPSQDVTFDEFVPFYLIFPYHAAPLPPSPLFLVPGPPPVHPLPPQGPAPSGVSQVDPLPLAEPVHVTVESGAAGGGAARGAASGGAEPAGAEPGGAEPASAEPGDAEPEGAEPRGAETEGAEPGGAESKGVLRVPRHDSLAGGSLSHHGSCTSGLLSAHCQRAKVSGSNPNICTSGIPVRGGVRGLRSGGAGVGGPAAGGTGAGGARANSPGGAGVIAGARGTGGAGAAGLGGARTRGTGADGAGGVGGAGAGDPRAGGAGARGTGVGDPGAGGTRARDPGAGDACAGGAGAGGAGAGGARAGDPGAGVAGAGGAGAGSTGAGGTVLRRPFLVQLPPSSLPPPSLVLCQVLNSPLPAPSPYAEQTDTQTERRENPSRPSSPVRAVRTDRRAPRPRPPPLLGTHIMALRPSSVPLRVPLPSPPASSLADGPDPESDLVRAVTPTITRLLATIVTGPLFESAAASALVAELVDFAAACRLNYTASLVVESESDCPPSVGDIPTPRSYVEAITSPYSSQWHTAMDPEMASWKSTCIYVDAVPPPGENIVDGMWIFRVKRPPGSPPVFKARYVARGSLHEEIWLRCPPGFTVSTTLAALGFAPSSADPSLFLRTDTTLSPFYVLVYVDDLVFATADTEALVLVKAELQERQTFTDLGPSALWFPILLATTHSSVYRPLALNSSFGRVRRAEWSMPRACGTSGMWLVLGGRGLVVLTGHADASWVDNLATQRYTFSLGPGFVSWWSTRSSSALSSSCEAEIYAWAMAAQELRWLIYLLIDLGERPCSPPVLYVDNTAMIALCQEHRQEHKMKHIALRYFLAREL
ncbi:unnamed protein product, partial [Closterium sp. NIES-53]